MIIVSLHSHHSRQYTTHATILVIIFWNFTMIQYRSDYPQVKRNVISSIANLVYQLPHDSPNDLRPRILGNKEILGEYQIRVKTHANAQSSFRKLNFSNSSQKARKSRYETFLFWSSFTTFRYFVPNILPTHTSIHLKPPPLARNPRKICSHTTHATHLSTPPTQTRQPRDPRQHTTHASTPPMQACHLHHQRQHKQHSISQIILRIYSAK